MAKIYSKAQQKKPVIDVSRREKEVLDLIAEELTTRQIAEKLCISEKTVEGHRENLLAKFQVKNMAGLILKAIRYGYIDAIRF
ncbi:response regulator transcription factor [Roseivirga thermotolerans]|uniref:response regulator transcription factor n=1 Tax=Roseivirga thermotolerans TaxID=1758176 RepID=UPI00273F24DF|nr:LuxR C-terminal-related transcriptional regulator [Roseivirga thermotolerans]